MSAQDTVGLVDYRHFEKGIHQMITGRELIEREEAKPLFVRREDLCWFAGLFEGEGYVRWKRSDGYLHLLLVIEMTDEEVIQRVKRILGGRVDGPRQRENRKPLYRWHLSPLHGVYELVEVLLPLLSSRRRSQISSRLADVSRIRKPSLSDDDLKRIDTMLLEGRVTQRKIGAMFGVSQSVISKVKTGVYGRTLRRNYDFG